jgi:hemolysin activation/secretion protein
MIFWATMILVATGAAVGQDKAAPKKAAKAPAKAVGDGPAYTVSQFLLDFSADLPVHPPTKQLMSLETTLSDSPTGFTGPKSGATQKITLMGVPKLSQNKFHASAIEAIGSRIVAHFAEWGYTGIVVVPHPDEIDKAGKDIRGEGMTAMRLVIRTDGTWGGVPGRPDETVTAPSYKVTQFIVSFAPEVPKRPPLSEVMRYEVDLGEVAEGYTGPRPGGKVVKVLLGDVSGLSKHDFYPSAIKTVSRRISDQLKALGFGDYDCIPHPLDIDADGKDTRFTNQTALRLLVRPMPKIVEAPVPPMAPAAAPVVEDKPRTIYPAGDADGNPYAISQIIIEYAEEHPAHPELHSVMEEVVVALSESDKGYIAAPSGAEAFPVRLADVPLLPKGTLYGSAIQSISRGIVAHYSKRGYIGINVAPHPEDIDMQASDQRPKGISALRMLVKIGRVTEVRTIAAGERVPTEERVNNPLHERLVSHSPLQPGADQGQDLLRKDQLDRYINWLNRHPGRRVETAISPAAEPGGVALDYLVTENKPWLVYFQASNTGTKQTDEWRERFGFVHNQLTNADDVLAIDYITAGFESAHAVIASYERPLMESERIRWRVLGSWSEYTASDVGFADERFEGEEWYVGGDLIFNIHQNDQFFVDLIAGVKWQNDSVDNIGLGQFAEEDFFLPHIGLQAERYTETSSFYAAMDLEVNVADIAETENVQTNGAPPGTDFQLSGLGRINPDENFVRVKFDIMYSMYIEPWLFADEWNDPSSNMATLAHELAFIARGQASPSRNPAQFERTLGGLYSVRGYPESVTAGDNVIILTAEYRLHVPRLFALEPDPRELFGKPFRFAPQTAYGRPDWDLIVRGFVDYGRNYNNANENSELSFETEFDMVSAGVGAELLIKRNFNIRVDWGYVLEEMEARVSEGSNRFHIVATLLY